MSKKKLVPRLRFKEFEKDGEWKKLCLDELVNIVDGDRGTNYPSKKDFTNDGHTLFLNASNVTKLGFKFEENQYISEIKSNLMGNGKLLLNDIILTSRGSIGNVVIYNERINGKYPYVRINSGMLILRNRNIADSYFIGQYLKSSSGKYQIKLISFGSAQPQLTKNDVSNYSVVHPIDLNEQRRIGDFLNKFDEMLQLQQSKVNKVKDLKSAYLSEMFPKKGEKYPKKRFEGFTKPWQLFKLGELGQFRSNGVNKKIRANDNPVYLLNYMDVYNKLSINQKNYKNLMKVTATSREVQENNIMKNDVFFTPTSETADDIGRVLTIKHDLPETVYSYHLIRFRPFEDKLYSFFPNYGFATKSLRKQMETAAQGVQRFVISVTAFKDLKVYLPSYEEQIKIANFFENLDTKISNEEEKLAKLRKLKQSYLTDMFV